MDDRTATNDRPARRFLQATETVVFGHHVYLASTTISRLLGLAWLDAGHAGTGLLIPSCRSVHTFGMRFPLDIHFLDGTGRPVRSDLGVPSGRVLFCSSARSVLELVATGGEPRALVP